VIRKVRCALQGLLRDEDGQASVEYILMLSIAMLMVMSVVKKFIRPYMAKMAERFSAQLQATLFSKANMHSLKIGGGH
jgi:Flp pilus assembly pilin Flp